LRVMLRSLGAPALGDPLYTTKESFEKSASDRCYLHACAMRIAMPSVENDEFDGDISPSQDVQILLPPKQGLLFCSPGFQDLWKSWVVPNMMQNITQSSDGNPVDALSEGNNETSQSRGAKYSSFNSHKLFSLIKNEDPIIHC